MRELRDPTGRKYPLQYVFSYQLKNGVKISIRPIRPEDETAMVKFHEGLSDRSVYLRYFHMAKLSSRVAHSRLARICFIDFESEIVLVAETFHPETGQNEIIAVGRLNRTPSDKEAEVALLVADKFQKSGAGSELMKRLIQIARDEKLDRIVAVVLPENMGMRTLTARCGFKQVKNEDLTSIYLSLDLRDSGA